MRTVLVLFGILFIACAGSAETIFVPDDYSSIQDAITASTAGDTIIVRPGTYVENVDFLGKAITLKSEKGAQSTVIDGNQTGSAVTFNYGEGQDTVIEGFTVTNGTGSVLIGSMHGGGIFCGYQSSPIITQNRITGNNCRHGGGIHCGEYSFPTIVENEITHNTTTGNGGGIWCDGWSYPTIKNNTIGENISDSTGGIFFSHADSRTLVDGNIIENNEAYDGCGGGLRFFGDLTLINNVVANNRAYGSWTVGDGGGIDCSHCTAFVVNNLIVGNDAARVGGGICCSDGLIYLFNNTLFGNTAGDGAGGLYLGFSNGRIRNTILWADSAPTGKEITLYDSHLKLSHSCVQGGEGAINVDYGSSTVWGAGMITDDPLFADSGKGDFHLTHLSPCRDGGYNYALLPGTDFEGDPRIAQSKVDMGADEFHCHLYSVGDATPGSSIDISVVGEPGFPALVALGDGIQDPPQYTIYGDLWLTLPLAQSWQPGVIPGDGVLTLTATVPSGWLPDSQHPFQALVGPWGNPATQLTNLMLLEVE